MNDKGLQILEQYDLTLLRSFGGRGAIMLETDQGLKILKEFAGSKTKLPYEQILLDKLDAEQICQVDRAVPNREGELITLGEYETPYLIRSWPSGKECDTKNEEDLCRSMRTLARIHRVSRGVWELSDSEKMRLAGPDRRVEYEKHNRELKRVQGFMRAKHKKGDFELLFLKYAEQFLRTGREAQARLLESSYDSLYRRALEKVHICHGEYIHHNIIMSRKDISVVNFNRCEINVQINDICLFLRKILEKQNWQEQVGIRMLEAYERELPLTEGEREYLAVCLYYPEKVWKLAHHYYHTNKAWIPEKSTEKLEIFLEQETYRLNFLKHVFSFPKLS